MNNDKLNTIINNIKEKVGDDNSAIINDDLVNLMNESNLDNQTIEQKENEQKELQVKYNKLLETNGNLMQKISFGEEKKETEKKDEEKNEFSFKSCFDEKGNFIIK